ncbi:MAG: Uma2 family endonuclease [Anaerolineales bacterium]|nr:Uma2 family endonuclease [Anaerolineales bacterium]
MVAEVITPQKQEKSEKLITGQELLEMGDIGPSELIEGRVIRISPTKIEHGIIESLLTHFLQQHVLTHKLGVVMNGETGIYVCRNPDTIRAADVLYISTERLAQATPDDFLDVAPELVVEIMSPYDRWSEIRRKLRDYFDAGVRVVLVVEPDTKSVAAFRSTTDSVEFEGDDILTVEDVLPDFKLSLADIFVT